MCVDQKLFAFYCGQHRSTESTSQRARRQFHFKNQSLLLLIKFHWNNHHQKVRICPRNSMPELKWSSFTENVSIGSLRICRGMFRPWKSAKEWNREIQKLEDREMHTNAFLRSCLRERCERRKCASLWSKGLHTGRVNTEQEFARRGENEWQQHNKYFRAAEFNHPDEWVERSWIWPFCPFAWERLNNNIVLKTRHRETSGGGGL